MPALFPDDHPCALRRPKTDPLILARLLNKAASDNQLEQDAQAAHPILIKWADLESSGQLETQTETQLEGDFYAEVFGEALGYPTLSHTQTDQPHWLIPKQHIPNAGIVDAALGRFTAEHAAPADIRAVVELKGPNIHLDRSRSNGRTAIQQCWDYLYALPRNDAGDCRWGIVSNYRSFRLYDRSATPARYEHFTLQSLRDFKQFRRFFAVFHRHGLLQGLAGQAPRTTTLIQQTNDRQRTAGDELYDTYSTQRTELINHLIKDHHATVDDAIDMAQRLLDRIIFIAFCEDRQLLPDRSIRKAYTGVQSFAAVTNPRWQNFKNLFRFIDQGSAAINPNLPEDQTIPHFNGGLFAPHPVDDLELDDEPWTNFFNTIGTYGFADEVNLDVLGHLFERSITELEKLKHTGIFAGDSDQIQQRTQQYAQMPQSAKRKRLGVYYTPAVLTQRVVRDTLDELIDLRFTQLAIAHNDPDRATPAYWQACLTCLRKLKVLDPACGSGAFLFQAYQTLALRYGEVVDQLTALDQPDTDTLHQQTPTFILNDNLYGVDLSPEAVEITQLALWIQSADRNQTLANLSHNIIHGNSLVSDPELSPHAIYWQDRFPEVFDRDGWNESGGGFDCVVGNPPWERIKQQKREFFSYTPEVILEPHPARARAIIDQFENSDPALFERWKRARKQSEDLSKYLRKSSDYPLTATGDINTYSIFAELASRLVAPEGRVGLLVPSGIASDKTTKDFFGELAENNRLIRLYDFENKKVFFPEVHASFKFCFLSFGGTGTTADETDFVFFAHSVEELENPKRRITLSGDDIKLLNPNTRTCPIFRSRRDAEITKAIYRRIPVLIDQARKKTGNPWGINFWTMFHQSGDAEHFRDPDELRDAGYTLADGQWDKRKGPQFHQVYEAKMVQAYDHRATSVVTKKSNWLRHGQKAETTPAEHQSPEFRVTPRWWASEHAIQEATSYDKPVFLAFKDISSATNQRTMIASFIPRVGVTHHLPMIAADVTMRRSSCLLANLNCFGYDFMARQKLGGTTFGFYHLMQIPTFAPDRYDEPCPWDGRTTLEDWIAERVLKLSCTAEDMLPLAEACDFTSGSFEAEYGGRLHKWNDRDRAQLTAELDAAYFHLYGLDRGDAQYILSTFNGIHDPSPLFNGTSVADHILDTYDQFAAQTMTS
ncbi:MAG: DNA methyltransferase [Planctomycetota bacterium]